MDNSKPRALLDRMATGVTTMQDARDLGFAPYNLSTACEYLPPEGVRGPIDALQTQVQHLLTLCFGDEA